MSTNIEIDFTLWGSIIPPKTISTLTEIAPEVQFLKGERNRSLVLPRENLWAIRSTVDSDVISDHWAELGGKLVPKKEVLREVAGTGIAKITIIVRGGSRIPSLVIPPDLSSFASFMNAPIEIDHMQR